MTPIMAVERDEQRERLDQVRSGGEPSKLGFTSYGEAVYPATNDENVDRDNIRVAVILTIMQVFTYVIHVP